MSQPKTADSGNPTPAAKFSGSPEASQIVTASPHPIEHLIEVVQRLSLAQDMKQIIAIISTAARQLTGADGASFILREGDECFYADEDSINPLWKGLRFPVTLCVGGWVMNNRTFAIIPDVFQDSRILIEAYRPTFVRSMAMVPIRTQDPIGAIGNYWANPHTPTAEQIRILQALADSTAVAIQNVRIRDELRAANEELRNEAVLRKRMEAKILRMSLTDELTGLNNRRGFLLRAEQLLKLVNRVSAHGWLIYINLDGLNRVNDELGYDAGDRLICNAAKVLRESFRDSDIVGRIGGDEFAAFATGASTPAAEIEERLGRNIQHHNLCFPEQPALSMNIGVIRCDPHSLHTFEDMIHQADAAMYIEKRRKRDRLRDGLID